MLCGTSFRETVNNIRQNHQNLFEFIKTDLLNAEMLCNFPHLIEFKV